MLLGPETFLVYDGQLYAGQIKTFALLVLLVISLVFRFEEEPRAALATV